MSNKKSRYGAIVEDVEAVIDSNAVSKKDRVVKVGRLVGLGVFSLGMCALGTKWDFNDNLKKIPFTSLSSSNAVTLKDVIDAYAFFEFSEQERQDITLEPDLNMIVSWRTVGKDMRLEKLQMALQTHIKFTVRDI